MTTHKKAADHANGPTAHTQTTPGHSTSTTAALEFLEALAPGQPVTFQTFDDSKEKRAGMARVIHADAGEIPADLLTLNESGAGIFVAVNATDGNGRKAENVTAVRALFVDFDTEDNNRPAMLAAVPLPPSAVVESSPGKHHAYWFTDGWPLDQFRDAQATLATFFGSDPKVCDLPRVMRLPGFSHRKGEPFQTRVLQLAGHRYDADTLRDWLATLTPQKSPATTLGAPPRAGMHEGDTYATRALEKGLTAVTMANEGARNATLNREAHGLYGLAKAGRLSEATITDTLTRAAQSAGLEPGEIDTTLQSAHNAAAPRYEGLPRTTAVGTSPPPQEGDTGDWPAPEPLISKAEPEPYPVEALPAQVRAAVEEVQRFTQAPVPLVATCALAALSLAIQGHYNVRRDSGLEGPVSLFALTIAESGERKTTVDGHFTKAVRAHEASEREKAEPLLKRHEADMKAWSAKEAGVTDAIRREAAKGRGTSEQERELQELQAEKPKEPRVTRMIYSDVTPEELAYKLAKVWPTGGVVSSEAGVVFGSHGMGKDSITRNLSRLNVLWDGGALQIDRRTSESFAVDGVRLTVALQVQEETLRSFNETSGALARGSGFFARFLVAWPESTQGTRKYCASPAHWPHIEAFNRRLATLLSAPLPITDRHALEPATLDLSPEAFTLWERYYNATEVQLGDGGEYRDVRDVASKSADNAVRIAALFHVFEGGAGSITADAMARGGMIAAWHLSESRRFFGELAIPPELANASRLDQWLITYCRRERTHIVPRREIQRQGPNPLRAKAKLDEALKELVSLGRVRDTQHGKRRDVYVNPALLEGDA